MGAQYDSSFFEGQARGSRKSARAVVPVVKKLVRPGSVLDVGCGLGTWLAEWDSHGVTDVVGIDGKYLDKAALQIDPNKFVPTDLAKRFSLDRKFDLVQCLEVAEHLDESCAGQFIECLVSHGDIVLFSAAIPGQGGTHHVNEQWPSYWAEMFSRAGFKPYDVIRPLIWADSNIEWWYRQNILIFSKERAFDAVEPQIDLVHPDVWRARTVDHQPHPRDLLYSLPGALTHYWRRKLAKLAKRI